LRKDHYFHQLPEDASSLWAEAFVSAHLTCKEKSRNPSNNNDFKYFQDTICCMKKSLCLPAEAQTNSEENLCL